MIFLMLFLSGAQAQTHTVDFEIPSGIPQNQPDYAFIWNFISFHDIAPWHEDVTVASDWPYITCRLDAGDVVATFKATTTDFPVSIPATASCGLEGHTLLMNLIPREPMPWEDAAFDPATGLVFDTSQNAGPTHIYSVHPLPEGPAYVEGSWPARLNPVTPWDGVECGVKHNSVGKPMLWVRLLHTAAAAPGYCVLEDASGLPHTTPLTLIR